MTYRPPPPLHGHALALQKYEAYLVSRGLRPSYIAKTIQTLRHASRSVDLDVATTEEITVLLDTLSTNMRTLMHSAMSRYYRWCIEVCQNRTIDPSWNIPRPRKAPVTLPRAIDDDDLEKALENAGPRMRVMLLLGCLAGLRCGEIGGLCREDISERYMTLRVTEGKGGDQRMLPLHPELLEALRAWGMPEKGPLFKRRDLRGFNGHEVTRQIGRYLRSLGIDASAHQLRHRFATDLYRETLDIRLVQDLLGHKKIDTTQRYAMADPSKAAGAVNGLRANTREAGLRGVS